MKMPLRIIYMGTPGFAVAPLKALMEAGYNIVAIITAPDKPGGRGKKLLSSEVKQFALKEFKKPVIIQPANLKDPVFLSELKTLKADLQVVVAFRMLPAQVWGMPPKGTINLHASLLPQYRGAAPINRVIINGEKSTGVTTFFINDDIDTGKIILQEKVEIPDTFNAGDLHDVLMREGAKLLVKTVKSIEIGSVKEINQEELVRNYKILKTAPKIFKEDCRINWNDDVKAIYNFIRGLSPYPTAYSELSGRGEKILLKIFNASCAVSSHSFPPGKIIVENRKKILIAVKNGFIFPEILQLAGKKQLDASNFINGFSELHYYSLI
jgi:methionyl-tRNA formyltransferase